jgi:translation initiation factor IF-2
MRKVLLVDLLDKLAQEIEKGKALVKATFKSSQLGIIAGCQVTEGTISRNNQIRLMRDGEMVWKGSIASLKRVKEDVREVTKGLECGILLNGFTDFKEGDILEAFDVTYITQEL